MSARRVYSVYVADMRDAIAHALQFTSGLEYDTFVADEKTVYAPVRALEVLGEAAKWIPEEVRDPDRDIAWRRMAGMRDVLIHRYDVADPREVWMVVSGELEQLLSSLERLQTDLERREDEEWERALDG